jgi:hypothetical protein
MSTPEIIIQSPKNLLTYIKNKLGGKKKKLVAPKNGGVYTCSASGFIPILPLIHH